MSFNVLPETLTLSPREPTTSGAFGHFGVTCHNALTAINSL